MGWVTMGWAINGPGQKDPILNGSLFSEPKPAYLLGGSVDPCLLGLFTAHHNLIYMCDFASFPQFSVLYFRISLH